MKIHHNTLKKAKAHGLQFAVHGDTAFVFRIADEGKPGATALASAADPKDALDLALLALDPPKARNKLVTKRKPRRQDDEEAEDGGEGDEEAEDGDEGKSVVKRKYKMLYKPHKMTCGDALAQQIRKEFMTVKDPDTKKLKYDWVRLTAFAKANGCWSDSYKNLNKGMRRMNIVNRLRAKIESADYKPVWNA